MNKRVLISEEEKQDILGMYGPSKIDEQLGSDIKSGLKGFGAKVGTVAKNLGAAVKPGQSDRVLSSPQLNAQMAKIKSKSKSLENVINDLSKDLGEILQIAQSQKTGQFQSEATQIETLINNYNQLLAQVNQYNQTINATQLQKPQLQQTPTTQTQTTTTQPTTAQQ
jgi:hypothetical protein